MKKGLKVLLILILVLVVAIGALLGVLTLTEYKPEAVEALEVPNPPGGGILREGQTLELLSWNIGYGGLGKDSDFFMDGGKDTRSADQATVNAYLQGIASVLYDQGDYDLLLLQEVDQDSTRTYGIDETQYLSGGVDLFALNYSCPFVPIPLPPIGKVHSGLFTVSEYTVQQAERVALPCPFSWPLRIANLKRCMLVSHLPIAGSDRELVLVNLHLEAYDSGEGKIAQSRQLMELLETEYKKGNYVIAGGDFNQVFPGSLEVYPNTHSDLWTVGTLEESSLPDGFSFVYDLSAPTCRLLNQPYDPADTENTQYYVIDGFVVSANVTVREVQVLDQDFACSDHNPVRLQVCLGGAGTEQD